MNESIARLGEALQPASNFLLEFGSIYVDWAATAVSAISSVIEKIGDLLKSHEQLQQEAFQNIDSQYNLADYQANGLVNGNEIDYDKARQMQQAGTFVRASKISREEALKRGWKLSPINGSHADGLDYVPFDGYVAELHQGEAVLTSGEASFLRSAMAAGRTLGGNRRSNRAVSDSDTGGSGGTPKVYDLTIPVELTIDGATFARKEYKYRIAEDNRRGVSLAGRGGSR